jgi:pyrimidine-nucleoside phosphorylase
MTLRDLIARKRDGGVLADAEWTFVAQGVAAGAFPDYQISAFLMACFLRGLDAAETASLTEAMLRTGRTLRLGHLPPRVDKHSTGGVGDKVSLALAPLVAACGLTVPMVSGRGLGHTGGTLDKLESIPGFRTRMSLAEAERQLERIGCVMMGQSDEIAPADRKLYALRDATATVPAMPLIAASIMSKKLAEDLTGLVLDVKTGVGAFLPTLDEELALANRMVALGEAHGCPVVAILSNMDFPLGHACGNAIEVEEAVALLRGGGPADVRELTLRLGAEMLVLGRAAPDVASATDKLEAALASGAGLERFRELVVAQGGDPRVCDVPDRVLPQAAVREPYLASRDGIVQCVNARQVGHGITALGGGRVTMEDAVDPAAGYVLRVIPGDRVRRGDALAEVRCADRDRLAGGMAALDSAIVIGNAPVAPGPLISHRVTAAGIERLG